jgi:prolyl 4-hydroxylase
MGFKKIRAPEALFKMLSEFWEKNKEKQKPENWGIANTYTNNWASPSYMVSVEDSGLRGGGRALKQQLWDAARTTISEWTGQELTECSLYGVRVYTEGAVLSTHVDRLPLVSSAIINVAQDLDEPWPLEVYGHDGKATNVTMEPGDMVLYESHSVLHGRPFPLKGRFMANVFIHFEPTGHTTRHHQMELDEAASTKDVHARYKETVSNGHGGHENADGDGLPPYIIPGTPEEAHWRAQHPQGRGGSDDVGFTTGSTPAHKAAQEGDLDTLRILIETDKSLLDKRDSNGWAAIHEAARAGHVDIVKYLVEAGADVNAKTHPDHGATPLWWAREEHEEDHPVIEFLESIGALEAGPDL